VNSAAVWEFYSHADLTNLTVDDHHDQSHSHNGADSSGTVNHTDLTNLTTDNHHAKSHIHSGDGSGTVEHDDTANITVDQHHPQSHTHNGTDDSGVVEHDDTANITVDQHHDQSHTHNGADDSGRVKHSDTTNIAVDDHHNKVHTHNGADGSGVVEHDDTANGTIANHDTGATGTELDTLTDGSNADVLHTHTGLAALQGDTTNYVATTGNDSTGTGNISAPWASIAKALSVLNSLQYEDDAVATVSLADGTYEMGTVSCINTHCPSLVITGENLLTFTGSAISAVSTIGGGYYDVTIVVNSTTGMVVGEYIGVKIPFPYVNAVVNGFWEIEDVPDSTHVKVRVYSPYLSVTPAAAVGTSLWSAPTYIDTIDEVGFELRWDHVKLTQLAIIKGTDGRIGILVEGVGTVQIGPHVGCNGYDVTTDDAGLMVLGAYCECETYYASDCHFAIWGANSAGVTLLDCTGGGCRALVQGFASSFWLDTCRLVGCVIGAVGYEGSSTSCTNCAFIGNNLGVWLGSESLGIAPAATGNYFADNITDLSPAANTEGNQNSYMSA
jgi:hypothetical protein